MICDSCLFEKDKADFGWQLDGCTLAHVNHSKKKTRICDICYRGMQTHAELLSQNFRKPLAECRTTWPRISYNDLAEETKNLGVCAYLQSNLIWICRRAKKHGSDGPVFKKNRRLSHE